MDIRLNSWKIKNLCGDAAFKKGSSYFLSGKVEIDLQEGEKAPINGRVWAGEGFDVSIATGSNGQLEASCSCPPVGFIKTYCQHVAAVLFAIEERQKMDDQATDRMLGLFGRQPMQPSGKALHFDRRETMAVEFICIPVDLGEGDWGLGIQIAVGQRSVERIKEPGRFLKKIASSQPYEYAPGKLYSPQRHNFTRETDAVLRFLLKSQAAAYASDNDTLHISAAEWELLLPLLEAVPGVTIEVGSRRFKGIDHGDRLPIAFELIKVDEGFQLEASGLDQILVFRAYDCALSEGKLYKLPAEDCRRLLELKKLVGEGDIQGFHIPGKRIGHFLETAVPGLMRLGEVDIAEEAMGNMEKTPLKAKLFLDRVRNRLLAGIEFHYGKLIINPCEEEEQEYRHLPGIQRERSKEQRIMKMMKESLFTQTPGGFYLQDEEAEYEFLFRIMPELEELVQVYATSAVKMRVQKGYRGPKIRVEVKERTDWLSFRFDLEGIPETEIKQLLKAIKEKRKYYRVPNGTLMSLETPEYWALNDFMDELDLDAEDFEDEEIRVPLIHGMRLAGELEEGGLADPGRAFADMMKNLADPSKVEATAPEELKLVLRDYQKTGLSWLKLLASYKFGGILADDMGLGKTLQSIAFIVSELPEIRRRKRPVLVVCPSSLVYNWVNELEKFAPSLKLEIIDGNRSARAAVLKELSHADVAITSYPSLRMDGHLYRDKPFHTIFFDEAQAFKNPVTQTAKSVKALEADYRFALTGTPIENSLDELWSIFRVVFPELLPNRKEFSELRREDISKRIRPFILRRTKQEVLGELPAKIETDQYSELYPEQKKLYAAYLAELKHDALKHLTKGDLQKNRIKILAGLTRLRQVCCHPALFVEGYQGKSAKFDQLMEILEECRLSGRRVLVFSQFTQMLGLIGQYLSRQGISYFYLDGHTPPVQRVEMCSRFNEGEGNLFLISLKAGGTGLNLTGADTVILYDLWWNPAVEQQAADRAHRMGQENEVHIIRMMAKGSIEEKISELQERKKNLIDEVIHSGRESLTALTEADIREILMIK